MHRMLEFLIDTDLKYVYDSGHINQMVSGREGDGDIWGYYLIEGNI